MRPSRFLFVALLLIAPALHALEVPPMPPRWFNDPSGLLNPMDAAALDRKLEAFEQRSGAQFIIYVFPSLEGEPSIEDFTRRCMERWKAGQSKYDNGLALFVFVKEKKIRIETGYGLEGTVTDALSSRVIREVIAPKFQAGDWAGGLNAGADALIKFIEKGEAPVAPMARPSGQGQPQQETSGGFDIVSAMVVLFVVFFIILPMFSRRRRGGGCGGCIPLLFLPGGGGGGITFGGGGFGGGGGFSGGGGSFGGGGATGGW
jgi:uncharacterized protein